MNMSIDTATDKRNGMKKQRTVLLLMLTIGLQFFANAQYDNITYNSTNRTYLLHVPPSYVAGSPMPLVVAMHGGGGWGAQLENSSKLSIKADQAGFIVVYPEGVKNLIGIRTWNAGGCCSYAMQKNIDDVGFLSALIDTLTATYSIDTDRIYATGMSNGAFMSYRLACERSNKIAAIAPVAGSMNVSACSPIRGVPVIHFHSYLDTNVPYQGGIGSGASGHYNPPIDSVLNVWADYSNCLIKNDTTYNGTDYTHVAWHGSDCNNEVHLYITQDGGHSWPGGNATVTGDPASTAINANDLMWTFFEQHQLNCLTTGIENINEDKADLNIYPNPGNNVINLKSDKTFLKIEVLNIHEQVVKSLNTQNKEASLSISELPNGLYFVKVNLTNGNVWIGKLIKE